MKSEWEYRRLGELVSFSSGGTPSKKRTDYWNGDIPWISAKTLKSEKITTSDLFITTSGLSSGSKIAPKGSILLLTRGSGLFNDLPIGMVESEVAFNQDIKCLNSYGEIENEFVFYWLQSQKKYLMAKVDVTGIGAGKFDLDFLQELQVPFPDKKVREKIIAIATAISEKIEANKKINDNLQKQLYEIYKAWYQDFLCVDDLTLIESPYGKIPQGWHYSMLGDLCKSVSVTHNFNTDRLIFLNTGDIEDGQFLHSEYMAVADMPGQAKKTIMPNDILYSEIRPINRHFAYVDFQADNYVVSTKLMVIRANSFDSRRLYHFLTLQDTLEELQMQAESRSGTFPQIRFENISKLPILIADSNTETAFITLLHAAYNQIEHNNSENKKLSELRNSLLPQLMSGKIDVSRIRL
jgi:putative type-1 restriction enzyme hindVIIP specificity protein